MCCMSLLGGNSVSAIEVFMVVLWRRVASCCVHCSHFSLMGASVPIISNAVAIAYHAMAIIVHLVM